MIIIFLLFILVQQDVNGTRIECAPFHSEVGLGTFLINTLASSCFWRFPKKNNKTHVALCENFSCPVSGTTDLVKVPKNTAKIFWLGDTDFL